MCDILKVRTEFKHINHQGVSSKKVGTMTEFHKYLKFLLADAGAVHKKGLRPIHFKCLELHYSLATQALNNKPSKKQMMSRMSVTL